MGVLWIHCWMINGTPRAVVAGVDLASVLALGGNGVDLFFVISGFCMYAFYGQRSGYATGYFWPFVKRRWLRLSPAFYAATLVYAGWRVLEDASFPVMKSGLVSLVYFNSLLPQFSAAALFWTLGVEWQFYLVVPLLFYLQELLGFDRAFWWMFMLFLVASVIAVLVGKRGSDGLTGQLVFRYAEFGWGMMAARMVGKSRWPQLHGWGLVAAAALAVAIGRVLVSERVLSLWPDYYNFFKILGFNGMGIGFGGLLVAMLRTNSPMLARISRWLALPGKWSYSFYLWHGLVHVFIARLLVTQFAFPAGLFSAVLTFLISTALLLPLSAMSFYVLERPFLASKRMAR